MANAEFSIESLIAESTGLVKKNPVINDVFSEEAYDGDEDSLTKEFYKSVEDFDSYCTLERINAMHNAEKIRMLKKLKRVYGESIEHYGAKLSIESYINHEIQSTEDDKTQPANGNAEKKENPIIKFFKFIGKMIVKAAGWIRKKLKAFWDWMKGKINSIRDRKGDNVVADVENIEKAMDSVIEEIQNDSGSSSDDNNDTNTKTDTGSNESKIEKLKARFNKIGQMIVRAKEKIKKAKETNEENAKSGDVAAAEKKLEESEKEVKSIIGSMAAFMKKPNAFVSRLQSLKQKFAEAKEKSKAIKSNKMDMKKILKELGTNKIVDVRAAQQGGNSKLIKYLTDAEQFCNGLKGKLGGFFREGAAPDVQLNKPENDKADFENFEKFVTNVLGWKFVQMGDVKKGEAVVREIYNTKSLSALTKWFDDMTDKLGACASSLEQFTSTLTSLAEQQAKSGSQKQANNEALTKLKNAVQIHTTIFTKSQMHITTINNQAQKIMRALYEVGTPGGENHSNMVSGKTDNNQAKLENKNSGNLPALRNAG